MSELLNEDSFRRCIEEWLCYDFDSINSWIVDFNSALSAETWDWQCDYQDAPDLSSSIKYSRIKLLFTLQIESILTQFMNWLPNALFASSYFCMLLLVIFLFSKERKLEQVERKFLIFFAIFKHTEKFNKIEKIYPNNHLTLTLIDSVTERRS